MRSVNTVLIELCLLHYMIGWRNSTNHYKQVRLCDSVLCLYMCIDIKLDSNTFSVTFMIFAWTFDINVYRNIFSALLTAN